MAEKKQVKLTVEITYDVDPDYYPEDTRDSEFKMAKFDLEQDHSDFFLILDEADIQVKKINGVEYDEPV